MNPIRSIDPKKAQVFFEDAMTFTTGPVELDRLRRDQPESVAIIDVRATEDYAKGHVPGAINLPKDQWSSLKGLQSNTTNVIYCYSQVCHLAKSAAAEFARHGFPVMEMEGGFKGWREHGLEIEKGEAASEKAVA